MSEHIRSTVSGDEVKEALTKIVDALHDTPLNTTLMACLATVFLAQAPELAPAELVQGVSKASTWIADYLRALDAAASNDAAAVVH